MTAVGLGVIPQFPASVATDDSISLTVANGVFTFGISKSGLKVNLDQSSPQAAMPTNPFAVGGRTPLQTAGAPDSDVFFLFDSWGFNGLHNSTSHLLLRAARGTRAAPTAIGTTVDLSPTYLSAGDYLGAILAMGHDGTAYDNSGRAGIAFRPSETWAPGAHGAEVDIVVTKNGTLSSAWIYRFANDGRFIVNQNTIAPETPLDPSTVIHTVAADAKSAFWESDTYGGNATLFVGRTSGGTSAAKTAVSNGFSMLVLGSQAWDGAAYNTNASITLTTLNAQSVSDHSAFINFNRVVAGATAFTEGMRLQSGLSIGTASDPGVGLIYQNSASFLMRTKTSWNNGAAVATGTLTNAPAAGNPTKWIPVDDNGTTRYIPAW